MYASSCCISTAKVYSAHGDGVCMTATHWQCENQLDSACCWRLRGHICTKRHACACAGGALSVSSAHSYHTINLCAAMCCVACAMRCVGAAAVYVCFCVSTLQANWRTSSLALRGLFVVGCRALRPAVLLSALLWCGPCSVLVRWLEPQTLMAAPAVRCLTGVLCFRPGHYSLQEEALQCLAPWKGVVVLCFSKFAPVLPDSYLLSDASCRLLRRCVCARCDIYCVSRVPRPPSCMLPLWDVGQLALVFCALPLHVRSHTRCVAHPHTWCSAWQEWLQGHSLGGLLSGIPTGPCPLIHEAPQQAGRSPWLRIGWWHCTLVVWSSACTRASLLQR